MPKPKKIKVRDEIGKALMTNRSSTLLWLPVWWVSRWSKRDTIRSK